MADCAHGSHFDIWVIELFGMTASAIAARMIFVGRPYGIRFGVSHMTIGANQRSAALFGHLKVLNMVEPTLPTESGRCAQKGYQTTQKWNNA